MGHIANYFHKRIDNNLVVDYDDDRRTIHLQTDQKKQDIRRKSWILLGELGLGDYIEKIIITQKPNLTKLSNGIVKKPQISNVKIEKKEIKKVINVPEVREEVREPERHQDVKVLLTELSDHAKEEGKEIILNPNKCGSWEREDKFIKIENKSYERVAWVIRSKTSKPMKSSDGVTTIKKAIKFKVFEQIKYFIKKGFFMTITDDKILFKKFNRIAEINLTHVGVE